ncbi:hypothetical protein F4803DRAFT_211209 [Xylaria telfairii]|nr:hypothetical protein F4803DRAFT_211209 [Xylaria telfairii]
MSPAASWAVLLPIQSQFMLCLFWIVSSLACIASLSFPPNPVDDQPTSTGKPGLARSLVRSSTFAGTFIHPVSQSVCHSSIHLYPSIPSHPFPTALLFIESLALLPLLPAIVYLSPSHRHSLPPFSLLRHRNNSSAVLWVRQSPVPSTGTTRLKPDFAVRLYQYLIPT